MTQNPHSPIPRMLVATGLLLGLAAAHAASGFTVNHGQEAQVAPGMNMDEVQQVLGRPSHDVKYLGEPGRTWTYIVVGNDETVFDVDFGADGKVASIGERMEERD